MQNIRSLILLLTVVLLAVACNNSSTDTDQTKLNANNGENITVPAPKFKAQDYNIPNELKYVKQKFDFLYDKFRPIGWSADGKFAYITEPADEACGCYFFSLKIKDMRSDKIIFDYSYNDEGEGDNLSAVWDKNYEKFKKELTKHKIIQKGNLKLEKKHFSINNQKYETSLKTTLSQDPDLLIETVRNTKVFISKTDTEKQVMDKETEKFDALLNVTLPGIIVSPYEERVAILLQEERRGYEGPPNVLKPNLTGASLTKGF